MLIKTNSSTAANPSSVPPPSTACGNCGTVERLLLHHVRLRGSLRRLCTSCVLRLHPQSFCPTCFQVYPPPPSNDAVLTCFRCHSTSHSHCVAAGTTSPPKPYICPICINSGPVFKLGKLISEGRERRVMNRDAAKKFLAATKIASLSMNKAAVDAKAEAEKRAKEAAFARKRAKEALEYLANLVVKEKLRKTEAAVVVSGYGFRASIGAAQLKRENNVIVNSRKGLVAAACVGVPMVVDEKIDTVEIVDTVENSNQVLVALNAVELKENENTSRTTARSVEQGIHTNGDHAVMDVDERGRIRARTAENVGIADAGRINGGSDNVIGADTHPSEENLNMLMDKQEDINDEVEPTANSNKTQ